MEPSVVNLCQLLIRSRLLPAEEVHALFQRWRRQAKTLEDDRDIFCNWLTAQQYLTEYQVQCLRKGHADHFFLGPYKLLDRIGKGRMAGVFKAVHQLGQTVAIKVLPPSKAQVQHILARFQREARLAVRLQHPNVVRTFQLCETGGLFWIVMEYLEGETLADVLERRGQLHPSEAVRIVAQALQGLQHIHEQGMVHRDLKPANLMLVPTAGGGDPSVRDLKVKILDIGLGRDLFDEHEAGVNLTVTGDMLGALDYLAPEQVRNAHNVDIRADIYSLGCLLYHALTGQPPFQDQIPARQIMRQVQEAPRPLRDHQVAVSDDLQRIVNRILAKDPPQRYATPAQAAQALESLEGRPAQTPTPAPEPVLESYLGWLEKELGIPPEEKEKEELPVSQEARTAWGKLLADLLPPPGKSEAAAPRPATVRTVPGPAGLPFAQAASSLGSVSPSMGPRTSPPVAPRPAPRQAHVSPATPQANVPSLPANPRRPAAKPKRPSAPPRPAAHRENPPVPVARPWVPPTAPSLSAESESSVELLSTPILQTIIPREIQKPSRLGRRDYLLLGIGAGLGAGGILLAGLIGSFLGKFFHKPAPEKPEADSE